MEEKNLSFKNGLVGGILGAVVVLIVAGVALLISPVGELITGQVETSDIISVTAIDVADVVDDVNPAVVSIVISKDVPIIETYFDDPFQEFFGRQNPFGFSIPRQREVGTEEKEIGAGSGFIISEDGFVVTNAHVVDADDAYFTVFLNDETSYEATVVAADPILDLAVLKIEADENLPFLEFGNSDDLRLGQGVIAIGNALGEFGNSVSTGVVSGLSRTILASNGSGRPEELEDVIQTDAAINPGNSGGPLLDFAGDVIGINVAVASGSENIGFAIPSNVAVEAIEFLKEGQPVARPFLGIRYKLVDGGAEIVSGENGEAAIYEGSPADQAGLLEGDVITHINGVEVTPENELGKLIRSFKIGDTVELEVQRGNESLTVEAELEALPTP